MTWLLWLSYTDLLTASIKLLISLLANSTTAPHPPTASYLPFHQQSNNKVDNLWRKGEQNDLMICTWIALIALLDSHSGLRRKAPELSHLIESSRLLGRSVKMPSQIIHGRWRVEGQETIRACQDMRMLHSLFILAAVTLTCHCHASHNFFNWERLSTKMIVFFQKAAHQKELQHSSGAYNSKMSEMRLVKLDMEF